MLATLVKLAQHEAGRDALVSAGVLHMVVQWLNVTLVELNSIAAEKQQKRVDVERKGRSAQQPAGFSAAQHCPAAHGCTDCSGGQTETNAADEAEATLPDASLQLLRLIRNLCAAGSAVAVHMMGHEVPAALANVIMQLDPHVAGEDSDLPAL